MHFEKQLMAELFVYSDVAFNISSSAFMGRLYLRQELLLTFSPYQVFSLNNVSKL